MSAFLENSELHMALLAWKNGDLTMIELKEYIAQSTQRAALKARVDELNELKNTIKNRPMEEPYVNFCNRRISHLQQALDTLKQQNLIDFASDPKTIATAVEGSMEKRQANLDTLKKESE